MKTYKKITVLIAFVVIASIGAYLILTNSYVFARDEEQYAVVALLIKSLFVMVDIACIVSILNKYL
ncbi:MAG: hypothetical protein MST07_05925 [Firmicutes bacterium]|nr:hypothetical protein [Bacillota bacterium]